MAQEAQAELLNDIFESLKFNNHNVGIKLSFDGCNERCHEVPGELDGDWFIGSFKCADKVRQTFAGFFLDIVIWMILDDCAEKLNGFLDVRSIKLFQLFDENVEHRNGNFGFFCFKGIDVVSCLFAFIFFFWGFNLTCDELDLSLNDILDQSKKRWQNSVQVGSKFFTIN